MEAGGAEGARVATTGGVGATGLVELGRFVQASSSKPLGGERVELDRGGGCTDGGEDTDVATCGEPVR